MAPAEQDVRRQGNKPVAHLKARDPRTRARNLAEQIGVPPDVVAVDDDADRALGEGGGKVDGVGQAGHRAAVGTEHRVQGLDAQPHPEGFRAGHELADRIGDHPAGDAEISGSVRETTGDEDEDVGLELGGLFDRAPVVEFGGASRVGVDVGEEATPAQTRDVHACSLGERHGFGETVLGDPIAPESDAGDVVSHTQLDGLGQARPLDRRLVEREARQIDHASTASSDLSARNCIIRSIESSGLRKAPAPAASLNTSTRCARDRCRCRSPIMRKCG